jgi:ubiquinone/menaquinone biosynthesis C-methylase UbiE
MLDCRSSLYVAPERIQMEKNESYWESWAPYWSYFEDNFLDIESINQLSATIESPILIIGAGQGILVEQLQNKGFKVDGLELDPQMIKYAKDRRGIDLIQADAGKMPFADNSYRTSIIATGVIDFIDDKESIESIVNEALRVTDETGNVLAAFYKYHPKVENMLRFAGFITDNDYFRFRGIYELSRLGPMETIKAIKKEANISMLNAFVFAVKTQMFLPRKEKKIMKNWTKLWKKVNSELDDAQLLIDTVPEKIPYRSKEQIQRLFEDINVPIRNMSFYYSCTIVQL